MSLTETNSLFKQALNLHQTGNPGQAAQLYQRILELDPRHADSLHFLGLLAHQSGNNESALSLIGRAIKISNKVPGYHYNFASILQNSASSNEQLELSIRHYKLCLKYQPGNLQAWSNLGVLYHDLEKAGAAQHAYLEALKINPHYPLALMNLGTLLSHSGHYDKAISYFDRYLSLNPASAEAHFKKAQIQLLKNDFNAGWANYRWMHLTPSYLQTNPARHIPFAKYYGQALPEHALLINADMGIGDEIMFLSILPDVLARVSSVIVEGDPRLEIIIKTSFPTVIFLAKNSTAQFSWKRSLGNISHAITLSELAPLFRPTHECFPNLEGYLVPEKSLVDEWKGKLNQLGSGLKVGISWRGGGNARAIKARSIALQHWKAIASLEGLQLINLQYGSVEDEIAAFNKQTGNALHHFAELDIRNDLNHFAALISALDLVISIDNSTVHFAGALNIPTWVILPHTPDWRWGENASSTPWYPSLTLFRAEVLGSDPLIKQLKVLRKELVTLLQTNNATTVIKHDETGGIQQGLIAAAGASVANQQAQCEPNQDLVETSPAILLLDACGDVTHWAQVSSTLAIHQQLRKFARSVTVMSASEVGSLMIPDALELFDDDKQYEAFTAAKPELHSRLLAADMIVLNAADSSLVSPGTYLSYLYIVYIAKVRMAKLVRVINLSLPETLIEPALLALSNKVLARVDSVVVNNCATFLNLEQAGILSTQAFDPLPLFIASNFVDDADNCKNGDIVIAGPQGWDAAVHAQLAPVLSELVSGKHKIKFLLGSCSELPPDDVKLLEACKTCFDESCEVYLANTEYEWLSMLQTASLLVTGSYQHAIAAAFTGTPVVLVGNIAVSGNVDFLPKIAWLNSADPALSTKLKEQICTMLAHPEKYKQTVEERDELLTLAAHNFSWQAQPG